jgi:hypothetical protein
LNHLAHPLGFITTYGSLASLARKIILAILKQEVSKLGVAKFIA